jgi:hypothetical protein
MGSELLFLSNSVLPRCAKPVAFDSRLSPAVRPIRQRSHELHLLPHSVAWTKAGDSQQIRDNSYHAIRIESKPHFRRLALQRVVATNS